MLKKSLCKRMVAATALLLTLAASPAHALKEPEVQRHVLDNGLTLLMVERHQAPVISSVITFKVGSANEPSGATGIAHMFEHMAFKGTRTVGVTDVKREAVLLDQIDELVLKRQSGHLPEAEIDTLNTRISALQDEARELVITNQFGDLYSRQGAVGLNASTGADFTNYYVSFPANRLPFWAAIESDRMANPVLREFYSERDVVLEERRMRTDNSPSGRMYEALLASAFMAHPYGNPVIGWPADIQHLTRPQAKAFFERYYVPENTVIALVGDLDPQKTIRLVERSFGQLPKRPAPAPPHTQEPVFDGQRRTVVRYDASPSLYIGYHRPSMHHDDDVVFDVIDIILSDGASSRLHKRLVLDEQIATSISVSGATPGGLAPSLFTLSATPRHPHTVAEAEAAILDELERLKTEPVSERELKKVVNQMDAGLLRGLASNAGMARSMAYFEAATGDWHFLFEMRQRITQVTADDVMRVANTYFDANRRVVVELEPTTKPEEDRP